MNVIKFEDFIWFEEHVILVYQVLVFNLKLHNCKRNLKVECMILPLVNVNVLLSLAGGIIVANQVDIKLNQS